MDTRRLLARLADLLNAHGCDSDEVARLISLHLDDAVFVELARLCVLLKRTLSVLDD